MQQSNCSDLFYYSLATLFLQLYKGIKNDKACRPIS